MESIKIGKQEWASVNLNIDHFSNGDKIQQIESSKDWLKCLDNKRPAGFYYDNNSSNGNIYGMLYNCYAVLDSRKIAPDGLHIPTDKEWDEACTIVATKILEISPDGLLGTIRN